MAKWERYIVYPLLFVALFFGVARETRVLQAAESIVDEIRARRIVVVDEAGREQVVLRSAARDREWEAGGQIEVFNKEGKRQLALGVTIGGGAIDVVDSENKGGVYLRATSLRMYDASDKPRILLSIDENRQPCIKLYREFGYPDYPALTIHQDSVVPGYENWTALELTARLNTGG
ncbi:MAG: hypothetical protein HPY52_14575 [Firmicutes bacterium]|nr:hypothetical protein [Bacillota bacterium]